MAISNHNGLVRQVHNKEVVLQSIPGNRLKIVYEYFQIYLPEFGTLEVPSGFRTDGASIPRFFWTLIGGPFGPYVDAAVVHDYFYATPDYDYTREEVDWMFYRIMQDIGISNVRAKLMYWAVRVGGRFGWNRARKFKYKVINEQDKK